MEKNIVMQVTHECNPDEARFRTGDFLIGTQGTLSLLKNNSSILSDKYYSLENATIEQVKKSHDVKYHHVSHETLYDFTFVTIHKEVALKHLNHKKQIPITHDDDRLLKQVLNDDEQLSFLKEVTKFESECVLNEDWLNCTHINHKLPQIEYYNNLKSDDERKIYADAIGQQFALNLILGTISETLDYYTLECFNTFFENTEFYYDDTINQNETQDNNEYLTSLNVKELWLPAEHFEIENPSDIKTVNDKQYIKVSQINEALKRYSFQTNRVYYDSDWWDNFLIKL